MTILKIHHHLARALVVVALTNAAACGSTADTDTVRFEDGPPEASTADNPESRESTARPASAAFRDQSPTRSGPPAGRAHSNEATSATTQDESPDSPDSDAPPSDTAFLGQSTTRAMWVWGDEPGADKILDNAGGAGDELLDFARQPHGDADRSINRLLFEARRYSNAQRWSKLRPIAYDPLVSPDKQAKLRDFLSRAHARGISVEYLDGQAIWLASDANADAAEQICRDVTAFNRGADDPTARFDGVHLDIEPHTVRQGPYAGDWWENKLDDGYNAAWTSRWKDILTSCRKTLDEYNSETGRHMTLAADLGTDYYHYNKPLVEFLNRPDGPLDYLTIMNYFDDRANKNGDAAYFEGTRQSGGDPIGGVVKNLAAWDQLPLMFAFETSPESIAPDPASFAQEGCRAMYRTIDRLLSEYGSANLVGVGIHHYGQDSFPSLE